MHVCLPLVNQGQLRYFVGAPLDKVALYLFKIHTIKATWIEKDIASPVLLVPSSNKDFMEKGHISRVVLGAACERNETKTKKSQGCPWPGQSKKRFHEGKIIWQKVTYISDQSLNAEVCAPSAVTVRHFITTSRSKHVLSEAKKSWHILHPQAYSFLSTWILSLIGQTMVR